MPGAPPLIVLLVKPGWGASGRWIRIVQDQPSGGVDKPKSGNQNDNVSAHHPGGQAVANKRRRLWDDPNIFPEAPAADSQPWDVPAATPAAAAPAHTDPTHLPYRAFGIEKAPVQIEIIDEYDVVYQPSCLHLEEPVLITPYWLGLGFNRMGFILHGQQLDALLAPLANLEVRYIHAFQPELHVLDTDTPDLVVINSITRYPIERYEDLLNEMLHQHRQNATP